MFVRSAWNGSRPALRSAAVFALVQLPVFATTGPLQAQVGARDVPRALAVWNSEQGEPCPPSWLPTFGTAPGTNDTILALTDFDDSSGAGPALYAGGLFTSAGGVQANHVARWDGSAWTPLGSGTDDDVRALTVFDDGGGSGEKLYAGGAFTSAGGVAANHVAGWNGSSWEALGGGMNGDVHALAVFDDGSGAGPALYAGGTFTSAGGVAANHVARWNGSSWAPLESGLNEAVHALVVFDDGSGAGPALHAGGSFTAAGGVGASRIARWNGSGWAALGNGFNSTVHALTCFDDESGAGPALHAGGDFTLTGGVTANRIARWDGTSWAALGAGMDGRVETLAVFDDGSGAGPALHAGGAFTTAGNLVTNHIARWNGSSWASLGIGMTNLVQALAVFDDQSGAGPALYVAGKFTTAIEVTAHHIARWNGSSFAPLGTGMDNMVEALAVFDDGGGSGPALYAAGSFMAAGGPLLNRIARWNGSSWAPLAGGASSAALALAVFDDGGGAGPALYAGGSFTLAGGVLVNYVARWNGTTWAPLGSGLNSRVEALAVFDDGSGGGPALVAAGRFLSAGGVTARRIARWNGSNWAPLGSGMNNTVSALAVFDGGGGAGPVLYAGGSFTTAGGVAANRIARWDGSVWSPVGSGMTGGSSAAVLAFALFDDGNGAGPALHAGGSFTSAGGTAANYIARWNGSSWTALGSGLSAGVFALDVFDDGSGAGPALHAGGGFMTAGGVTANHVARWNGSSWAALADGTSAGVAALAVFDDGSGAGPALYVGGDYLASPASDSFLARWQGCPDTEPPTLSCPHSRQVEDLGSWGELVTFSISASDRDPHASVVCVPPSGSFFPRGTTLVTCTATDGSGNQASCTFPVTVLQPRIRRR